MGYIDSAPDQATKVELIKTLQTLTEGKVRCALPCCACCAVHAGDIDGGQGAVRCMLQTYMGIQRAGMASASILRCPCALYY